MIEFGKIDNFCFEGENNNFQIINYKYHINNERISFFENVAFINNEVILNVELEFLYYENFNSTKIIGSFVGRELELEVDGFKKKVFIIGIKEINYCRYDIDVIKANVNFIVN